MPNADPIPVAALHAALLAAFPTRGALAQMLLSQLGCNLNTIAAESANLDTTVYEVVQWAGAQDREAELLQGAAAANPTNAQIQALVATLPPRPPSSIARARTALLPPKPPDPWIPRPEFPALKAAFLSGEPALRAAEGKGGLGKTMLAARLAAEPEIQAAFPDGVLWLGVGPHPDLPKLETTLAAAFGIDLSGLAEAERLPTVRLQLRGKRCLLLFDDVWSVTIVGRLRELTPHSALLTTRDGEVAFAFAPGHDTAVAEINPAAVLALLQQWVPLAADDPLLPRVAAIAAGLPLALNLLAPLVQQEARLGLGLAEFVAQIESQEWQDREFAVLDGIVSRSVEALAPPDQQAFAQLAVFGARPASFDIPAAASIWGTDETEARGRMRRLVMRNIVDASGTGRFSLHQFVAECAARRLPADDPARRRYRFYVARTALQPPPMPALWVPLPEFDHLKGLVLAGAPQTLGITGPAGVGKTTLATALAWDSEVQRAFPGGVRWVRGAQFPDSGQILDRLAASFSRDLDPAPVPGRKVAQVRAILADPPCLVILDDIEEVAGKEDLIGISTVTLIVGRGAEMILGTDRGQLLQLGPLTDEERTTLLQQLAPSLATHPGVQQLVQATGDSPLRLRMLAALLQNAVREGQDLDSLVARLLAQIGPEGAALS